MNVERTPGASRVVALDDFFPDLGTGFRVAEFTWMLHHDLIGQVLTTQNLAPLSAKFGAAYPDLVERVAAYRAELLAGADLAWIDFLNNADHFLSDLEEHGVPFVVTLYPGGGLNLGSPQAGRKLAAVMSSPLLRAVITTQPRVTEYVLARFPDAPVHEILGIAVNSSYFGPGAGMRMNYYGEGKPALDVAFVAHRYRPDGADKGYGTFLDTVRELRAAGLEVRAHVVGGFAPRDLPDQDLDEVLTFHGVMDTAALKALLLGIDLVISPNRPGVLSARAFDGFPTGSVIEAALCGAGMVATDLLQQNVLFRDGRDILIVPPEAPAIAERIVALISSPGGIRRMAQAGLAIARRSYGVSVQLWGRRRVLEAALGGAG
jgi:glycosyltransferase involved in cell wall biosynthesis